MKKPIGKRIKRWAIELIIAAAFTFILEFFVNKTTVADILIFFGIILFLEVLYFLRDNLSEKTKKAIGEGAYMMILYFLIIFSIISIFYNKDTKSIFFSIFVVIISAIILYKLRWSRGRAL